LLLLYPVLCPVDHAFWSPGLFLYVSLRSIWRKQLQMLARPNFVACLLSDQVGSTPAMFLCRSVRSNCACSSMKVCFQNAMETRRSHSTFPLASAEYLPRMVGLFFPWASRPMRASPRPTWCHSLHKLLYVLKLYGIIFLNTG